MSKVDIKDSIFIIENVLQHIKSSLFMLQNKFVLCFTKNHHLYLIYVNIRYYLTVDVIATLLIDT